MYMIDAAYKARIMSRKKISNFVIPKPKEYELLYTNNYNVKQLKSHKDNFSKYGKDAESVMYAVATKQAKKGNRFKA